MNRAFLTALALSLAIAAPAIAAPHKTPVAPAPKAPAVQSAPEADAPSDTASASTSLAASGSALVEKDEDGLSIDWTRLVMRIKGVGMAPERGTLGQRRLMAKRTAFADGYRRLSEALDDLRVNGEAYVRDLTAVDDASRLGINDLVREARAVDVNYWADGSVEVTLEIPLSGPQGLTKVLLGQAGAKATPAKGKITGLVVDARGTGAQPALKVKLHDASGHVIADNLSVAYFHQNDGTKEQVGDSPLHLKAKRAYGVTHADILLTDDEASKVKAALKDGANLPLAIVL